MWMLKCCTEKIMYWMCVNVKECTLFSGNNIKSIKIIDFILETGQSLSLEKKNA